MTDPLPYRTDCRHFRGEKPCLHGEDCRGCEHYSRPEPRILIVKLDALGDVLRTTPLLRALHRGYDAPFIEWLVTPAGVALLDNNPMIDRVLPYGVASIMPLQVESFDLVLSLDKTPRAAGLAMLVDAEDKRGFGLNPHGNIYPLNAGAHYAFRLGLCDELKFRQNERTYQDVIFECAGLQFAGEDYVFGLTDQAKAFQQRFVERHGLPSRGIVGVNCGGSAAFANKMWAAEQIVEFVRHVRPHLAAPVLLYGSHPEADKMAAVVDAAPDAVLHTGLDNSLQEFAALVGLAEVVVTGDSLGMHLALAQARKVVALFGPTCAQEIELYGRGKRIVSPASCVPCYRRACEQSPTCMEAISADEVAQGALGLL